MRSKNCRPYDVTPTCIYMFVMTQKIQNKGSRYLVIVRDFAPDVHIQDTSI